MQFLGLPGPKNVKIKTNSMQKDMKMHETDYYDLYLNIQHVRMHKDKIFTMKIRKDANFITQSNKTRDFTCQNLPRLQI